MVDASHRRLGAGLIDLSVTVARARGSPVPPSLALSASAVLGACLPGAPSGPRLTRLCPLASALVVASCATTCLDQRSIGSSILFVRCTRFRTSAACGPRVVVVVVVVWFR